MDMCGLDIVNQDIPFAWQQQWPLWGWVHGVIRAVNCRLELPREKQALSSLGWERRCWASEAAPCFTSGPKHEASVKQKATRRWEKLKPNHWYHECWIKPSLKLHKCWMFLLKLDEVSFLERAIRNILTKVLTEKNTSVIKGTGHLYHGPSPPPKLFLGQSCSSVKVAGEVCPCVS